MARERTLTVDNITLTESVIRVTRADNDSAFVGYVSKAFDQVGFGRRFDITSDVSQALSVSVPPGSNVSLTILNGLYSDRPYLGFTIPLSWDLSTNSYKYALLNATSPSPPNSPPSSTGPGDGLGGETSVWTSQADSNVLTPTWTNTGGFAAPTFLAYDPTFDLLLITGSVSNYNAEFGSAAYPVHFTAT